MNQITFIRIFRIVWLAVKIFLQVTFFQKRNRGNWNPLVEKRWNEMITKQAKEYKNLALKLGGLMIKLGQFLSTRADIMPPSFLAELEGLTDRVPSVSRSSIVSVLEEEWNLPHTNYLEQLSDSAVASASIGEVYKGVLKNGMEVAVKVQRPGTDRILRADFKAIRIVIWLVEKFTPYAKQIDFKLLYAEMTDTIGAELNFLKELQNGRSFADRFDAMEGVRIPLYFDEYTTRRVLVMEWIEGARITDLAFIEKNELDRHEISERLFILFLEQVLYGGQFHADPHGGNILLEPNGGIVLIDFGMIGNISKKDSQAVLRAAEGVIFKNYDQVLDSLEDLRFLLPQADRAVLGDAISRLITAYESNELSQMDSFVVERLLNDMQEIVRTQPVQLPAEFAFFGRAASIFVGVLHVLDPNVDLLALARPRILEWASSQKEGKGIFGKEDVLRWALNATGPLRVFPQKVINYLEEPERLRHYLENRDGREREYRRDLQSRMFAGIFTIISFTGISVSVWFWNEPYLWVSSVFFVGSLWAYRSIK
ncbi:putative unusual protein kinase regulating ubiquinone biosynthesis (AarF/ABC1/UbiB family) [Planomicrobium stackebrandtii]|uniref:Unusual protein kinase regulating ubiquinone biosynthesis (AarF/ABC1/UbiB family) n=1 Tax=Planomicrobium stackebrandtii TaxID=253160 RepID=A0ABU0GY37_9BACL|nr:AarF/UbiB family protein [Planomicrobium stackebrandtii]MDQ0430257.1 putative unusual protein kinase regulating ubiquinone biosynthesis (AarF/ABC1/UbiB family) [Planomicrobium stackebrandtii]